MYDGKKADIFALGIILFLLNFGNFPWEVANDKSQIYKVFRKDPNYLFKFNHMTKDLWKEN